MATNNSTLSRKTLYALADVGDDYKLADNLENILTDFEAIGDLLSCFDSDAISDDTVRHLGWHIQRRAIAAKALMDEWRHAKHKQRLEAVPGGVS